MEKIKKYPLPGEIYDHYKGGRYEVITLAKHTEAEGDDEDVVVYKSVSFGSVHVRPLKMWFEEVEEPRVGKSAVIRFTIVPKPFYISEPKWIKPH